MHQNQNRLRAFPALALGGLLSLAVGPARADSVDLVHRYSFNDGTANDSAGASNGTLVGGATVSAGALALNGAFHNGVALPLSTTSTMHGSFTIEDWLTYTSGANFTTPFTFGSSTGTYLIVHLDDPRVSKLSMEYGGFRVVGNPVLSAAEIMVATTYDRPTNTASLYINGIFQSSQVLDAAGFDLGQVASGGFNGIGGFDAFGDGSAPGTSDEFRIYTGSLSGDQVAADYAAGPNTVLSHASVGAAPLPASFWSVGTAVLLLPLGLRLGRKRLVRSPFLGV